MFSLLGLPTEHWTTQSTSYNNCCYRISTTKIIRYVGFTLIVITKAQVWTELLKILMLVFVSENKQENKQLIKHSIVFFFFFCDFGKETSVNVS